MWTGCLTIEEINTFEHRSLSKMVFLINVGTTVIWQFMWFSNLIINTSPKQVDNSFIPKKKVAVRKRYFQMKFEDFDLIMFFALQLPGYQKKSDCS
jgi:hypothetical protein